GFATRAFPVPLRFGKPIRTQALHVVRWLAFEDRFDHQSPDTRGAADPMRVATTGHNESFHPATLSNDEVSVRCKGWPTTADADLFRASRSWKEACELLFKPIEHRPIRLQGRRLSCNGIRTRVGVHGPALPTTQQQTSIPGPTVESQFWNTKAGSVWGQPLHRHRHKILVPDRDN